MFVLQPNRTTVRIYTSPLFLVSMTRTITWIHMTRVKHLYSAEFVCTCHNEAIKRSVLIAMVYNSRQLHREISQYCKHWRFGVHLPLMQN